MQIRRLKKRQDFLKVAQKKIVAKTSTMLIQFSQEIEYPNAEPSDLFVGFTASKKVGGAVQRNRAKRRLRSIVDAFLEQEVSNTVHRQPHENSKSNTLTFVFIAVRATVDSDFEQLKKDFSRGIKYCLSRNNYASVKEQ